MSTSKEFIQIANQLPVLAKAYFNNLPGTPEEIAKRQKELLKYLKNLHQQLRVKGTKMVTTTKGGGGTAGTASLLESDCPGGMVRCADGTCAPSSGSCGEEGLIGEIAAPVKPVKPAKKAAPAKKKATTSKKK